MTAGTGTGSLELFGSFQRPWDYAAGDVDAVDSVLVEVEAEPGVPLTRLARVWLTSTGLTGLAYLTLSASSGAEASPAGTGALTLSGSAVARAASGGLATIDFSGTLTAQVRLTATGTIDLSGSASPSGRASGSGSLSLSGSGETQPAAAGTGSLSLSGTGAALVATATTGTGSLELVGSFPLTPATGTGSLSLSGSLYVPVVGQAFLELTAVDIGYPTGPISASITLSGSAVVVGSIAATGSGFLVLFGIGTAIEPPYISKVRRRASAFVGG